MENLAIAAEAARVEAKTFTTTGPNGEQLVVQAHVTVCPVGYPKSAETWDGFSPHETGYCTPVFPLYQGGE